MLAALGVILLYVGALIEVADISLAVIASLLSVLALIEYGRGSAWMVFAVTTVLSFLLLPSKTPAVMYACFFGFYPILKEGVERLKSRVLSWVLKLLVFNICLVVIFVVVQFVFTMGIDISPWMYAVGVVLCEAVFLLYDIALTRLITYYLVKLRNRLKLR